MCSTWLFLGFPTEFYIMILMWCSFVVICSYEGQKLSFSYDKVFDHNASQEDVFVEISQLVQSALDGYKVLTLNYNMMC
jgi:hypothetical protein